MVLISAQAAAKILENATAEKRPVNRAGVYLKTLTIAELSKSDRKGQRGWVWRGRDADLAAYAEHLCEPLADMFPR